MVARLRDSQIGPHPALESSPWFSLRNRFEEVTLPQLRVLYLRYFASQSSTVRYQNWLSCGLNSQWP